MLSIDAVSVHYAGITALDGVSVEVGPREYVALVGPNGAGKTTLLKAISGVVPLRSGSIRYEGDELTRRPSHLRAHLGIAHVPEGRLVFPNLTVLENLRVAARSPAARERWQENLDTVFGLFPVLGARPHQLGGTLSGGEQQMLAIGRGLASSPTLLLLDEPSLGLAPAITELIFEVISQIRADSGVAILLVEQKVAEVLERADRAYVLENGRIALAGPSADVRSDPRIRQLYLGL